MKTLSKQTFRNLFDLFKVSFFEGKFHHLREHSVISACPLATEASSETFPIKRCKFPSKEQTFLTRSLQWQEAFMQIKWQNKQRAHHTMKPIGFARFCDFLAKISLLAESLSFIENSQEMSVKVPVSKSSLIECFLCHIVQNETFCQIPSCLDIFRLKIPSLFNPRAHLGAG